MKKILLMAVIAILTVGMSVRAEEKKIPERQNVPAYKGIIERVQPNGDTLRTYLRGDERHHWMTTEDGWQILETKKGWLKYAKKKKDGTIVASCKKAHNADKRCKCEKRWLEKHGVKKTATL